MRNLHDACRLLPAACFLASCAVGCSSARTAAPSGLRSPTPPAAHAAGNPSSEEAPASFADVAAAAGLNYRWQIAGKRPLNILQTIGNGCAFLDYDNDGNLDVLLVGPALALYRGDGHGHFADVSAATGLSKLAGHFLGC